MGEILEIAEALWRKETDIYTHHPLMPLNSVEMITEDTGFIKGIANSIGLISSVPVLGRKVEELYTIEEEHFVACHLYGMEQEP